MCTIQHSSMKILQTLQYISMIMISFKINSVIDYFQTLTQTLRYDSRTILANAGDIYVILVYLIVATPIVYILAYVTKFCSKNK